MSNIVQIRDYQAATCRACGSVAPYNVAYSNGLCGECDNYYDDILEPEGSDFDSLDVLILVVIAAAVWSIIGAAFFL